MKLQYLGHSSFRLISEMGTTVVCDPYESDMVGLQMPSVRCDVVTISHHHSDHDCVENLLGGYATLDEVVSCAADDIAVQSFETFHDNSNGAKRGKNLVFCFLVDGLRVVHAGDIGFVDENIVAVAKNCDVLLAPVGGVYTIDAVATKQLVDEICPRIVVPMHYMTPEHKFRLNSLDDFLNLFDASSVERSNGCSLELFDAPQNEQTKVIVLQKYED